MVKYTMKKIVECDVVTVLPQRKHYDVIKAPHYGALSCYFDFLQYYDLDQIYISNGETTWSEKAEVKSATNISHLQMHIGSFASIRNGVDANLLVIMVVVPIVVKKI